MGLDMYLEKDGKEVAYWRKSNQIHNWFVENIQNGNDDCGTYPVTIEQLKELKELCERVINNHDLATELLPTVNGFFFGGTNYDEYYFDDVEHSLSKLDKVINNYTSDDLLTYTSSW